MLAASFSAERSQAQPSRALAALQGPLLGWRVQEMGQLALPEEREDVVVGSRHASRVARSCRLLIVIAFFRAAPCAHVRRMDRSHCVCLAVAFTSPR